MATIAQLAEQAFIKAEVTMAHAMMNTPPKYEDRKKAYIAYAEAQAAAEESRRNLDNAIKGDK